MRTDNGPEALVVEMSTEGTDGPWVEIARHDRNQGRIWQWHSISPDELHKLGIVPSANTALRFIVNDALSNTNVEAGIDGLRIRSVNCIPLVPGDVNGDGVVNVDDLLEVIANWGESGPAGDANEDGVVDVQDLLLVILNWGAGG